MFYHCQTIVWLNHTHDNKYGLFMKKSFYACMVCACHLHSMFHKLVIASCKLKLGLEMMLSAKVEHNIGGYRDCPRKRYRDGTKYLSRLCTDNVHLFHVWKRFPIGRRIEVCVCVYVIECNLRG